MPEFPVHNSYHKDILKRRYDLQVKEFSEAGASFKAVMKIEQE